MLNFPVSSSLSQQKIPRVRVRVFKDILYVCIRTVAGSEGRERGEGKENKRAGTVVEVFARCENKRLDSSKQIGSTFSSIIVVYKVVVCYNTICGHNDTDTPRQFHSELLNPSYLALWKKRWFHFTGYLNNKAVIVDMFP